MLVTSATNKQNRRTCSMNGLGWEEARRESVPRLMIADGTARCESEPWFPGRQAAGRISRAGTTLPAAVLRRPPAESGFAMERRQFLAAGAAAACTSFLGR